MIAMQQRNCKELHGLCGAGFLAPLFIAKKA